MSHENRVTVREETALDRPTDLLSIIMQVVQDPRMDVEKMEKLLAMQERVVADQRRQIFFDALARLESKLPQIEKYGKGKNSRYAKLEDIDIIIRPLLAEEGFSFSFDEEGHTDKTVTFVGRLAHRDGHAESKRLTVPIDTSASNREGRAIRPAIQDAGSTVSYARRYLIKMHLNIIEKDEDTDGQDLEPITDDQAKDLDLLIKESGADKPRFLKFMGVEKLEDILKCELGKAANALREKAKMKPL